jgi:nucleoside phosphorylase
VFQAERERGVNPFQVHIGAFLSGGARIHSGLFRDELVTSVPAADDVIVGGEMEGVGLLSISPANDPVWIVVKGISDFADEDTDACGRGPRVAIAVIVKRARIDARSRIRTRNRKRNLTCSHS